MEEIFQIHVKLVEKASRKPIAGSPYIVRFYDKDLLKDDFLGVSEPDDQGHAILSVSGSEFRSKDSPFEKHPDIYFTVTKNGIEIYRSPVCKNLRLEERSDFSISEGRHCNLGVFLI